MGALCKFYRGNISGLMREIYAILFHGTSLSEYNLIHSG